MPVSVRVVDTLEEFAGLRPAWDELYAATPEASPYMSYDWIHMKWAVESAGERHVIVVVEDDSGLAAVLPLLDSSERSLPFPRRELQWAGGGWSTRQGGLIAPRWTGPLLTPVIDALQREGNWARCTLTVVPEDSPLVAEARGMAGVTVERLGETIVIELPDSADEYLAGLSSNRRGQIRSVARKLARQGEVTFRRVGLDAECDLSEVDRLVDDALVVSDASWQGTADHGRAIGDPESREFVREVSKKMAARRALDLSVLYLDGRPVSFIWGAARPPATTISKLAFVSEMDRHRPGVAHMWWLIQDSIERGMTEIDYGHEFADYKRRWSPVGRPLYELRLPLPTLPSRLLHMYENRPDWLDRSVKRFLRRPAETVSSGEHA
jgi:CelD/BcsL family acetyltransferase involved in cellulose biosynthesis